MTERDSEKYVITVLLYLQCDSAQGGHKWWKNQDCGDTQEKDTESSVYGMTWIEARLKNGGQTSGVVLTAVEGS